MVIVSGSSACRLAVALAPALALASCDDDVRADVNDMRSESMAVKSCEEAPLTTERTAAPLRLQWPPSPPKEPDGLREPKLPEPPSSAGAPPLRVLLSWPSWQKEDSSSTCGQSPREARCDSADGA
eukprot:5369114-Prymnesium_polylepis.1